MTLHTGRAADYHNGAVQHIQRPLHLSRKIHMARRVQQGSLQTVQSQQRLLGKNSNPPLPFQGKGIQKSVAMIHAAKAADRAGNIEHCLGQGSFSRVHMGQNADDRTFHTRFLFIQIFLQYNKKQAKNLHPRPPAIPFLYPSS